MADHPAYFIVLNGGSGHADAAPREAAIRAELDAAGATYEILVVDDAATLSAIAKSAVVKARACDGCVVAAGGDGTINAVAQEVLDSGCRFGVLPQGTFNFFGRTHGIDADPSEATRALLAGEEMPAQVGRINDKVFLVNASLGLYPDLLEDREAAKQKFGRSRGIAMAAGLRSLVQSRHQLILQLDADGQSVRRRTPTLVIGNNQLQLDKVGVAEADAVEAGQLVAIVVRPIGTWALLGLAIRGVLGRLGDAENADTFAFRRLRIDVGGGGRSRAVKAAVDGEIVWLQSPLTVEVAPTALRLIVPPAAMQTDEAQGRDTAS